jgi:hypothetical protein
MSEAVSLPHSAPRPRSIGGLSLSGALSLLAVAAVLVVVSLPRMRGLALAENEVDASATAQLLAAALSADEAAEGAPPSWREFLARPELAGVLSDGELVAEGTLLRRHGYLFELTRLAPGRSSASSSARTELAVRAWPWAHGATGEATFLATAGGAHLVHPNESPCWQGLAAAGVDLGSLAGWRPLR